MEQKELLSINKYTKILTPAMAYNIESDSRILIPFTSGEKIGFVNREGRIVVRPLYAMYYGECYTEEDLIRVTVPCYYAFPRANGKHSIFQNSLYGLINHKGDMLLEPIYYHMIPAIGNKRLFTVQNNDRQYGVITADGVEIIPFGKYDWIDGFDKGLARVKLGKVSNGIKDNNAKWGLVNERGNIVLPIEYDDIWNFYNKNRDTTKIIKGNNAHQFKLSNGVDVNDIFEDYSFDHDDYGSHYGEFEGSYAQDIMGYSDDVINDAFEGDPDNYWNID